MLFVILSVFAANQLPCLLLAFTEVSILSFGLEPVDIVNHCWSQGDVGLPLLLISHAKELIVSKMTLWFQKKKWLLFLTCKDIFETEKASFFYWLLIWQHIKSVHLECLKTKEPYVGPISYCQIGPVFLQFGRVLLSPIFLYFWTPKVLDTLHLTTIYHFYNCHFGESGILLQLRNWPT